MNEQLEMVAFAYFGGVTIFLGGLLGMHRWLKTGSFRELANHWIVGVGGGLLLSAVSLVLVPHGMELSPVPVVLSFMGGAICFGLLDRWISTRGGSKAQVLAMMMDFVPEAIAMGAVFQHDHNLGILLCIFIGAQNFPEGFNSYRELEQSGWSRRSILTTMIFLSFAGIPACLLGEVFLKNQPDIVAVLMSFAGGGILYLLFQDIAPLTRQKDRWLPPIGVAIGFALGMLAEKFSG